jgi:hypothetical protein
MSDSRIVDIPSLAGTRTLLVDGQGNADYTVIQEAIDAAAAVASASERWQVRVAPGEYAENLVLADYVDLIGLGPGHGAVIAPSNGIAIQGNVDASMSYLKLATVDAAVIQTSVRVTSPNWYIVDCFVDQTIQFPIIDHGGGKIHLRNCIMGSGKGIELSSTGSHLYAYHSIIRNKATSGSGHKVITVDHGTLYLYYTLVENLANAGYAIYINNTPGTLKAQHCIVRRKDSTYSVAVNSTSLPGGCNFYMHGCLANAAIDPLISEADDVYVNTDV